MAKDKANSPPASVPVKSPTRDEGKYFELVGAKEGEVVVRFPPEASGFLHIGHAKAALLNAHYQRLYKGRLVFRFDDTNPEKEKESFEKIIEGDVELLEIKPDHRSYTSDHFADLLKKAEEMIKNGKAYVDDTPPEQMKADREARVESKNRSNDVAKNLAMWKEMVDGTALGLTYCLRAKVDMTSDNGCMRDPTIYRCKPQEHPRTGNTYKVYPTYDFACPYVDSVEGITHALRTSEYMDRDVQYYWFCDAMNIRRPQIAAYSRLNLMNTVLSKRKLTYFVQEGIVDGWDDPRMPTVRGVLRRGLTVEGLKLFIASQGSSKAVVVMEWDKIWAFNRKVIDPLAARYSAVELADVVRVQLEDDVPAGQVLTVALHPKNAELGSREVPTGKQLLIDQTDAQLIVPNSNVTFINWGNVNIVAVEKDAASGLVTAIKGKLNLENKDYKKTLKVTWLEGGNPVNTIPAFLTYYDHIIKKPVVGKDEDFKQYVNRDSKMTVPALVDGALKNATKGTIVQIQRKGFFIVDEPYNGEATVDFTGKPKPIILISVPDGTMDINIFPKVVQEWRKKNAYLGEPTAAKGGDKSTTPVASTAAKVDISKLDAELSSLSVQIDQLTAQFSKLKLQYKSVAKKDWKPTAAVSAATSSPSAPAAVDSVADLDKQIRQQGDLVRKLKADKADKATVEEAVKKLLSLKGEFKTAAKIDWKPDFVPPQSSAAAADASNAAGTVDSDGNAVADLDKQIRQQGDLVRKLKADKAAKATVEEAVKKLLSLKGEFKTAAKIDWKPDFVPPQSSAAAAAAGASNAAGTVDSDGKALDSQIKAQGDRVRQLKTAKASAEALKPEVEKLLALKKQFKEVTGTEWKPEQQVPTSSKAKTAAAPAEAATAKSGKQAKSAKTTPAPSAGPAGDSSGKVVKKTTRLGMETSKAVNYSEWFTEVITKAEMIEYYDVSGCYILRPWSYAIWEAIQGFFDAKIKTLGVKNCYFPCFISKSALETEKTHIADFAPEVAWVTKSGTSELSEPIAIRPTSETVMYPSYAKWTQSHRDLPIQLNQWCNVVRWEFKQPTPFLRTREFLWQEGHSAFATKDETMKEVLTILDFYAAVYEELLAIPVIKGQKTEKEKFAGGDMTTTIEAYVDVNGRGIQGATSHFLGQNFSKMFDLSFEDPNNAGQKCYAYQTSWGLSTRTIGAMIMIHGDDKGLVLPPRVACLQVIIVPCGITVKSSKEEEESLIEQCNQLAKTLKDGGVKVQVDDRDHVSPGWKFNHWELKGVPIRVELGPKDLAKGEFVTVRRDTGEKESAQLVNALSTVKTLLESIHKTLFDRATKLRDDRMVVTEDWKVLLDRLNEKYIIMAPFCGDKDCEDVIKKDSTRDDTEDAAGGPLMGAKSLCIPFKQPKELQDGQACIHPDCKRKALKYTLFGRSY